MVVIYHLLNARLREKVADLLIDTYDLPPPLRHRERRSGGK